MTPGRDEKEDKNVSLGILPFNQSTVQMDMDGFIFFFLNHSSFFSPISLFSNSIYLLLIAYFGFLIQDPDWIRLQVIVDQSVRRSLFI